MSDLWSDRSFLRDVQYKSDGNLAARQSIYAYQEPRIDLPAAVLGIAAPVTGDVVADVGCGNGPYLAELDRRGFAGQVLGVDLSPGMLDAARERGTGTARLAVADAGALPLADGSCDVLLAMHMLYHVPSPADTLREFRRVTRPGGKVIVGLNGTGHLGGFRAAYAEASGTTRIRERITLDEGETLARPVFGSVTRHDFTATITPPPEAIAAYIRSMSDVVRLADPEPLVTRVQNLIFRNGSSLLPITTHSGVLVCR